MMLSTEGEQINRRSSNLMSEYNHYYLYLKLRHDPEQDDRRWRNRRFVQEIVRSRPPQPRRIRFTLLLPRFSGLLLRKRARPCSDTRSSLSDCVDSV
jgi:hypothetical protein